MKLEMTLVWVKKGICALFLAPGLRSPDPHGNINLILWTPGVTIAHQFLKNKQPYFNVCKMPFFKPVRIRRPAITRVVIKKLQFSYFEASIKLKGCTSYRRSLQPAKKNIQHFKSWKFFTIFYICGSFLAFWIRIRIQQLKLMRIHADPDPL